MRLFQLLLKLLSTSDVSSHYLFLRDPSNLNLDDKAKRVTRKTSRHVYLIRNQKQTKYGRLEGFKHLSEHLESSPTQDRKIPPKSSNPQTQLRRIPVLAEAIPIPSNSPNQTATEPPQNPER
ncbi:hypothetical protein DL98DRAFT_515516 [Cadophora sp. DSE1049]|nr:hypothetical protein DL98DRAFT_515516 [Cadophora sp. DSE1049]